MNIYPHLTNVRSSLADKFYALQTPARRDAIWATLIGQNTKLAIFPEQAPEKSPNRKFIGVKDIPVGQIVGTLNRDSDFDDKFRPLKSYLRDRWINTYLAMESETWLPILVHKIGDAYYVEDGHHRVSVARSLGMTCVQAKVWDYTVPLKETKKCEPIPCPKRSRIEAYATQS